MLTPGQPPDPTDVCHSSVPCWAGGTHLRLLCMQGPATGSRLSWRHQNTAHGSPEEPREACWPFGGTAALGTCLCLHLWGET